MSRLIPSIPTRAGYFLIVISVLVIAALMSGCGNNDDTASYQTSPSNQTPKLPASGPAISTELSFDQLTLDSTPKRVTDKNGLAYLEFSYTDNDGKVYKCKMPEAMAQGTYPPQEWLRTFTIYRLPEVVKQKPVAKKSTGDDINDFPFIAPKQRSTPPQQAPAQKQQPSNLPTLPPLSSPSGPGAAPQSMPRGT